MTKGGGGGERYGLSREGAFRSDKITRGETIPRGGVQKNDGTIVFAVLKKEACALEKL